MVIEFDFCRKKDWCNIHKKPKRDCECRKLWIGGELMDEVLSSTWDEYKKKPVVIKAVQMEGKFKVQTLEGIMEGQEGDWLIEGVNGELYPCKPDVFKKTYEKVKYMDIVFDFDGVLCEYEGWRGHDKIGKPIQNMIELVEGLYMLNHTLKLSTTRLNPYPKGNMWEDKVVSSGEAKEHIMDWLQEQGILKYFKEITGYKPFGDVYIDDRALRFQPDGDWDNEYGGKDINNLMDALEIIQADKLKERNLYHEH